MTTPKAARKRRVKDAKRTTKTTAPAGTVSANLAGGPGIPKKPPKKD